MISSRQLKAIAERLLYISVTIHSSYRAQLFADNVHNNPERAASVKSFTLHVAPEDENRIYEDEKIEADTDHHGEKALNALRYVYLLSFQFVLKNKNANSW